MKNKKITGSDVGIVLSIVGIIASVAVIVIDYMNKESIGVGIGLVCFCCISLSTNIRNKKMNK